MAQAGSANGPETLYKFAVSDFQAGRLVEALQRLDAALALNRAYADAWNARGVVLHELGRVAEARESFHRAVSIAPRSAAAWINRGNVDYALGRDEDALVAYEKAVALGPSMAQAWSGYGNILIRLKRVGEAVAAYDKALVLAPDMSEGWVGRGNAYTELKRFDDAAAAYDKALTLRPDSAVAWCGRGNLLHHLKRGEEGLAAYDKAISLDPSLSAAWLGRGNVATDLDRFDDASAAYQKALAISPHSVEAWLSLGNLHAACKRLDDAFAAYDKALAHKPDKPEAWLARGNLCFECRRFDDASAAYQRALAAKPNFAGAWLGVGNVLTEVHRHDEAHAAYERAIAIDPDLAEAHFSRGNLLLQMQRYADAVESFDTAFRLNARLAYLEGARLYARMHICDWRGFEEHCARLTRSIGEGRVAVQPFALLAVPASAADHRRCAELHIANLFPASPAPLARGERYRHERIRLAYLSADFHDHATAYLMAGLFERHDRTRFETIGVSFGVDQDSDMRRRLKGSFEQFLDVRSQTDQAIAQRLRDMEVDIAVDLKGFTMNARTGVFARRPAPIQVNYLGYPGTMGADYIDYIVADRVVIPDDAHAGYAEKVVSLPDCYQVNDDSRLVGEIVPSRREAGLPEHGVVFCSFNNTYKITPDVFDVWMSLLRDVTDSVLWLYEGNADAPRNLRSEAARRGIAPERLIFAPPMPIAGHLARHRLADLFLDTVPCNAHTTASDALWCGLPVVTCLGHTFAGRVAASLLTALGLTELVAGSLADYRAIAVRLARDPDLLAAVKAKLARNRPGSPLFDTVRMTRHIEAAFTTMWERHQSGERPAGFAIASVE